METQVPVHVVREAFDVGVGSEVAAATATTTTTHVSGAVLETAIVESVSHAASASTLVEVPTASHVVVRGATAARTTCNTQSNTVRGGRGEGAGGGAASQIKRKRKEEGALG